MNFELVVAEAAKAVVDTPEGQAALTGLITSAEGELTTLIQDAVKNIKLPSGLAGVAIGTLETPIVNSIVADIKTDPAKLAALIKADIDAWEAKLAGAPAPAA